MLFISGMSLIYFGTNGFQSDILFGISGVTEAPNLGGGGAGTAVFAF